MSAIKCIYHDIKTFQMDTLYKPKSLIMQRSVIN